MQMNFVASSSISAIGYDSESLTLRIAFKAGGTYDYHGVTEPVAMQFLNAPSKGQYYVRFIKGHFNQQRIQ